MFEVWYRSRKHKTWTKLGIAFKHLLQANGEAVVLGLSGYIAQVLPVGQDPNSQEK